MTGLLDEVVLLGGPRRGPAGTGLTVTVAESPADLAAYHRLRSEVFVDEQRLFEGSDRDGVDDDPRTQVLLARAPGGEVLGGVRIHPMTDPDLGWWRGSRLVVGRGARMLMGVGATLVRAACAAAEQSGALRFDATVQARNERMFTRLGWVPRERIVLHDAEHVLVEWPVGRVQRLVDRTKAVLGPLVGSLLPQHDGFLGDDGAPVPATDVVAACDAVLPSMVERDPEWAGWCAVLVNFNDLVAMGATPVGLLDALGARDASFAGRVLHGLRSASEAFDVPVLGGHTQLGVPASLAVTAVGRTASPVPGGGGSPGEAVRVTADLGGSWRPGYRAAQWDSSTRRSREELRQLPGVVPALRPTAAKDVSMSGLVGTAGMLAEASGCGAVLDVASVPRPTAAGSGDWLTCFPGFALVTTEPAGRAPAPPVPGFLTTAVCGELVPGAGVHLRWPDGRLTEAVSAGVTGLGPAGGAST